MLENRPPPEIQWFETIQIISVALGLIQQFASPAVDWFDAAFGAAFIGALTLLISRRRKNWARWALTISFGLGIALLIYVSPIIIQDGISVMSVMGLILQAVGIALLFTRRSSAWLRRSYLAAVADVFE